MAKNNRRNDTTNNVIIISMKLVLASSLMVLFLLMMGGSSSLPRHHDVIVHGFVQVVLPSTNPRIVPSLLTRSTTTTSSLSRSTTSSAIYAGGGGTKTKKKRPSSSSTGSSSRTVRKKGGGGGFGGASMEPCPCGSGDTYSGCCGRLHKDINAFRVATAEQVVRARYSAYAKKQADFLMASTHPLNKAFDTDLKRWKDTIRTNMYDNFDMPRCVIVEERYDPSDDTKATVQFIAEMVLRETGENTSFMETSTLERATTTHRGWLYRDGVIEAAPSTDEGDETGDDNDDNAISIEEKISSLL